MTVLRNWWYSKKTTQKNNWRMVALFLCIIASGYVEAYTWAALIAVIPAAMLIYLEITDEQR